MTDPIFVWAVPTLGGQPRPYLDGVAEFDWSADGSQLVYHTTGPGDPMFVRNSGQQTQGRPIFAAAPRTSRSLSPLVAEGRLHLFRTGIAAR